MATNGANINNPSVPAQAYPLREQTLARPVTTTKPAVTTTNTKTSKTSQLDKDSFRRAELKTEQELKSAELVNNPTKKLHSPEAAQKLAQSIANNASFAGAAAQIIKPDDWEKKLKKEERKIGILVSEGKKSEAFSKISGLIQEAFLRQDLPAVARLMETQRKIPSGQVALAPYDLQKTGQISGILGQGLATKETQEKILAANHVDVSKQQEALRLRNKAGQERSLPPSPSYVPSTGNAIKIKAQALVEVMMKTAPWDSLKLIAA